jgi:Trm5-related predicted tRNA methylase
MDPAAGGGVGAPDIEQLIQILTELGITPEQLEAAISGKQAAAKEQQKLAAMKNMIKELVGRSR